MKENTTLTAVRGLLRLEKAQASGRVSPEVAKTVEADAAAALAGGETIEGNYLAGRLAEATGDLARAEASYKAALEAYLAATSEEEITRRLDAVYGAEAGPADPFLAAASRATLRRSR